MKQLVQVTWMVKGIMGLNLDLLVPHGGLFLGHPTEASLQPADAFRFSVLYVGGRLHATSLPLSGLHSVLTVAKDPLMPTF